ncbi:MAG TPA: hypothetical protein EYQ69_03210 [Gemmatimonadetes bacterium]|jgi:hypothetical protein|nr:hypothetical protein [Gemmatimonadota bacterium]
MKLHQIGNSTILTAIISLLALSACEDSMGPDAYQREKPLDSNEFVMDMALVAADAVLEDIDAWGSEFDFSIGLGFEAATSVNDKKPSKKFHPCKPGHHKIGWSCTREVSFFNEAGNSQTDYDKLTTARVHAVTDISGDVSRERWSALVNRERDMTITGLAGENTHRTINGSGNVEVSRSKHLKNGMVREYDMTGSFTKTNVVMPVRGTTPRYPISGTITRSMQATVINGKKGDREKSVEMTITFDGDSTASMIVNGEELEIDLTTRKGKNPLRKKKGG